MRSGERVEPIEVGGAVFVPGGRLLVKMLSGCAYEFAPNLGNMTHHMPLTTPEPP